MSLSSLIVQREVASIRQVEEALARQVLYGGDLVTNLMEVVQLPETVLVPLLAESVGLLAAPVGMLPPPTPQARALVPEEVAARKAVMPMSVEGERLILAVSEPLGRDDLEELAFALGVRIEERIAPSVRIAEALARVYGVPLERRMARLVGRLAGHDPTVPNSLPPLKGPKPSVAPLPGALTHDLPKLNPPGMPVLGTLRLPEPRAPQDNVARVEQLERFEDLIPPKPASIRAPTAAPAPTPGTTSTSVMRAVGDLRALPNLLREPKPGHDLPRRRGPVTLDRVTEELGEINDREGLLRLFFDFGRQFFEYSAIFVVHGELAEGRDAFGSGAGRDRVLAIGVPLEIPSMLRTVRERAAPLCAVPESGGLDGVLMADLKRDMRSQVLVIPIVVRSRVVAFFIADDGPAGIDPSSQGEVTTVAALVGREFERLIVRMKLSGFSGDVAAADQRRVDPRRVESKRRRPDVVARREAGVHALEQAVTSALAVAAQDAPDRTLASAVGVEAAPAPTAEPAVAAPKRNASERPGAFRPSAPPFAPATFGHVSVVPDTLPQPRRTSQPPPPAAAAPLPHIATPLPRSYPTLRNFPAPTAEEAAEATAAAASSDATDKIPAVADAAGAAPSDARAPALIEAAPVVATAIVAIEPLDETDFIADEPVAMPLSGEFSPPPPQVVAVRRPSGRPIPREEVDEGPVSSTRFATERTSRPPPGDLRQARLLRDIDALAAQFVHTPAPSTAGPASARARNVPPHLPPSSSRGQEPLPSVIVDPSVQVDLMVERFVADPKDDHLEAELLRLGQQAMPSIMKHFPGPITIMRDTLDDSWPRVSECGPVLRLIAGQRRVALPFVLRECESTDTETRFWATYLLTELAYPEAIPAVVSRLFDDSKRVRRAARLVAHVLGDSAGATLVEELYRIVRDPKATSNRRIVTLDALGEMRDPLVVPVLLGSLADDDEEVALATRRALMLVSRQDFGRDTRKWLAWWQQAAPRHRIEWLIDALTHDVPAIRRAAGQELKALTEQYFGYYDDLPKKERERAQQKYRDWWVSEGQARFRKG
jgi:hypothetical protein